VIDLHAHVLPGLDDGPKDLAQSLALTRSAANNGVEVIAATPHLRTDHPLVRSSEIAERCSLVNRHVLEESQGIRVVPAAEVDLLWAQSASDESLREASYGQRATDILVETPYGHLSPGFEESLLRFASLGLRILLAHPERNEGFHRDRARLAALVENGVLLQITARSLTGASRDTRAQALALWLVQRGLAHVIASDAHSADGRRQPDLAAGVAAAARVAPRRAGWMVTDAPAAILAGEDLPMPPILPRRRWWSRSTGTEA